MTERREGRAATCCAGRSARLRHEHERAATGARTTSRILAAIVAASALLLLIPAGAAAQAEANPCSVESAQHSAAAAAATIQDFAWLEGTWLGEGPGGATAEAHYLAPEANTLPSIFWLRTDERVVVIEAVTLVHDDDGIRLYVRHFTPSLEPLEAERALTLRLIARDADRFVFQNLYDENPRCSVIERTAADRMLSWSLLLRDDESTDEIRVEYRRMDD